jgi:hypothetical protein
MAAWSIELSDGTEYALSVANGIAFKGAVGHRMAPVLNVAIPYALVDGALYQRTQVNPRVLTLLIDAIGTSEATLVALEDALVAATNPHRTVLPVQIWYRSGGAGTGMYVNCYYEGGLEGLIPNGFTTDSIPMRFLCADPYWYYETPITGQALDVYDSMAVANRIIERDADGNWTDMHAGADDGVWCIAVAANGDVYAGGDFHNIGGVACAHIARWDVATSHWIAMGAGMSARVRAMIIAANGDLYVGGDFVTAGGGAALHIAKWVQSTTTWSALGAGLDNNVTTLCIDASNNLYVGGYFHDVSGFGITLNHVAKWNGAWVALGVTGVDDYVTALAAAANGDIYVGGFFHNAAGGAAAHVAKWNGTAWSALAAGVDDAVTALAIAANGNLYAGGHLHNAGIVSALHVAEWNGISWLALGAGVSDVIYKMAVASDGSLSVGGVGVWNTWRSGIWLPGLGVMNNQVNDMIMTLSQTVLAGSFTAATTPGVTHITNAGTARGYPTIAIAGPGRLLYLINYTTNQVIYFDITLVASETLTIDLRPGYKTITSSFRGNMIHGVLAGALTNWYLAPGLNHVGCYVDNAAASAVYGYTPTYWGAA